MEQALHLFREKLSSATDCREVDRLVRDELMLPACPKVARKHLLSPIASIRAADNNLKLILIRSQALLRLKLWMQFGEYKSKKKSILSEVVQILSLAAFVLRPDQPLRDFVITSCNALPNLPPKARLVIYGSFEIVLTTTKQVVEVAPRKRKASRKRRIPDGRAVAKPQQQGQQQQQKGKRTNSLLGNSQKRPLGSHFSSRGTNSSVVRYVAPKPRTRPPCGSPRHQKTPTRTIIPETPAKVIPETPLKA